MLGVFHLWDLQRGGFPTRFVVAGFLPLFLLLTKKRLCQNLVVAVSAEGWFHLFDFTAPSKHLESSGHHELSDEQKLGFKQHIPANTKVMLIRDIGECRPTDLKGLHGVSGQVGGKRETQGCGEEEERISRKHLSWLLGCSCVFF